MKIDIQIVTARFKGKLVFAQPVTDMYSEVQVIIDKDDLDDTTIDAVKDIMMDFGHGFALQCMEAKDTYRKIGDLVITIETKTIEM